ncbi:hypothetical protein HPB47_008447 [Ixodes persulcatus]|uniref:Uncharacterized protein n=1 Tax=Ixodes persulcatus TaxID=34615 RepID=A0AC60P5K4_IXOPE|nr:hypothetical protein HPB47_008447 [Ixodes persulcatus]
MEFDACRQAMMKKQSLQSIYALHKSEPSPCTHCRGNHESALLFQARVGALMTNCRRAQLFGDTDKACPLCGQSSEDVLHVLLWCPALDHCLGQGTTGRPAKRGFPKCWDSGKGPTVH